MSVRTRRLLAVAAVSAGAVAVWSSPSGAAVVPQATAELENAAGDHLGTVTFLGRGGHATQVRVELDLPSSAPGLNAFHGLHVHANGVCAAPFTSAAGHWDDASDPHTHGAHLGDLPSVLVNADGSAELTAATGRFDVDDLAGRAVILHAGRDNFGNVPSDQYTPAVSTAVATTEATGNAGARYGCGVIELAGNS